MASILFVAFHFAPENTSGTHRSLHFARALVDAGHEVTVLAGPRPPEDRSDPGLDRAFPWPDRVHRVELARSLGSLYVQMKTRLVPRPRRSLGTTAATGAAVEGKEPPGLAARLRQHVRAWDALPDHVGAWLRPATRAGRALGRRVGADVVIASGPPWTGVMVGHRVARSLGLPFVADFRDPWSTGSGETDRAATDWAQHRVEGWEATVLREAAVVCFNSPRLAALTGDLSHLGDRARVILNGSDAPRQGTPALIPKTTPLRFSHFGSLYAGRSVASLVRALDALIERNLIERDDVEVELVGDNESARQNPELSDSPVPIRFTPHLTFTEATKRMADPGVLVCVQTAQHANLIPTKLFDYLCTGNPVVVISPEASASWDVAAGFARSYRLDLEDTERNRETLASLICAWKRGELCRVTAEDTEGWRKEPLGAEFVRVVEDTIGVRAGAAR